MEEDERNLKRCPVCGSLSADDESNCGVCGRDLRGVPFGSENEKIPVQEQQVKTSARKRNVDRNMTVVGLLVMIFGIVLLFFNLDQIWVLLLGVILIIIGLILLAHEVGGGGERKEAKIAISRRPEGQPRGKY